MGRVDSGTSLRNVERTLTLSRAMVSRTGDRPRQRTERTRKIKKLAQGGRKEIKCMTKESPGWVKRAIGH